MARALIDGRARAKLQDLPVGPLEFFFFLFENILSMLSFSTVLFKVAYENINIV